MTISKEDLQKLVRAKLISSDQAEKIRRWAEENQIESEPFNFAHLIYYIGGLLSLFALWWLLDRGWEIFGARGLTFLSGAYALVSGLLGYIFSRKPSLKFPAAILLCFCACIVSLFVYGIERMLGWPIPMTTYHDFFGPNGSNFAFPALATGLLATYFFRQFKLPLLTAPIAVAVWAFAEEFYILVTREHSNSWEQKWISILIGFGLIALAYFLDRRTKKDFSFWFYLWGLCFLWGGVTAIEWGEFTPAWYLLFNLVLIFLSFFLSRVAFIVFGSIGVFVYLVDIVHRLFQNSLAFPVFLIALGFLIIFLGVQYQKNRLGLERKMQSLLPKSWMHLRPGGHLPN